MRFLQNFCQFWEILAKLKTVFGKFCIFKKFDKNNLFTDVYVQLFIIFSHGTVDSSSAASKDNQFKKTEKLIM